MKNIHDPRVIQRIIGFPPIRGDPTNDETELIEGL